MALHVIKIGGALLLNKSTSETFIKAFSALKEPKILVHGGGEQANKLLSQLGIIPKKVKGRRITDLQSLEIVQMVYAGQVNKDLVVKLQANNCMALGLSGADGNLIEAKKRPIQEIDYGYAGDIEKVNNHLLEQLLKIGHTPVVCSLTHDRNGQMLNTNADTIAASIASAMSPRMEVYLWYLFDKKGLLLDPNDEESVITNISIDDVKKLKESGVLTSGILPKVHTASLAIKSGVQEVCFCHYVEMQHIPNPKTYSKLCL